MFCVTDALSKVVCLHGRSNDQETTRDQGGYPMPGQGLLVRVHALEAELLALRDRCVRLETECQILHEHIRDLEESRREDRSVVEELRLQVLSLRKFQGQGASEPPAAAAAPAPQPQAAAASAAGAQGHVGFRGCENVADKSTARKRVPTAFVRAPAGAAAGPGGVGFAEPDEDEDDDEEDDPEAAADARKPVRSRQATGWAGPDKGAAAAAAGGGGASPDGAAKRGLVFFRERDSLLEIDNVLTGAQAPKPAKGRVPTSFNNVQPNTSDGESSPSKRGVLFRERESVLEIDNLVTGVLVEQIKNKQGASGAGGGDEGGEKRRSVKQRVPTKFAGGKPGRDDDEDDEQSKACHFSEQVASVDPTADNPELPAHLKSARGRVPTAFVKRSGVAKPPEADEDSGDDGGHQGRVLSFNEKDGVIPTEEPTLEPGAKLKASRGRVPTAFVKRAPAPEEEDEEEDEAGGKSKLRFTAGGAAVASDAEELTAAEKAKLKPSRGRVPTKFVKGAKPADEDEDDEDEDEEDQPAAGKGTRFAKGGAAADDGDDGDPDPSLKKSRGRVPTKFVKGKPSPDDDEDEDEDDAPRGGKGPRFASNAASVEDGDDGEPDPSLKRSKGRVPTKFVKGKPGAEDEEDDEDEEEDAHRATHFAKGNGVIPGDGDDDGEPDPSLKRSKGRVPTKFVKKSPAQGDDDDEDDDEDEGAPKGGKLRFNERKPTMGPDDGEPDPNLKRSKGRVPTKFVKGQPEPDDDDDEDEDDGGAPAAGSKAHTRFATGTDDGKSTAKMRVPTAFVKGGPPEDEDDDEDDDDDEDGSKLGKGRMGPRFSNQTEEKKPDDEDVLARFGETMPASIKPTRGRVPTAFVKRGKAQPPDEEDEDDELLESGPPVGNTASSRTGRTRLPTALGRRNSVQEASGMEDKISSPSRVDQRSPTLDALREVGFGIERYLRRGYDKDMQFIQEALRKIDFFHDLTDEACLGLARAMDHFEFDDGVEIARQGSTSGTHFFVVEEGIFEVFKDEGSPEAKPIATVSRGCLLGESVLLLSGAQNATVRAKGTAKAYGMSGWEARKVLQQQYQEGHQEVIDAINAVIGSATCSILQNLTQFQEQVLYDQARTQSFASGEVLQHPGQEESKSIHVLIKGNARLLHGALGETRELDRFALMGDTNFIFGRAAATVECHGPVLSLVLSRDLLEMMFGDKLRDRLLQSRITDLLLQHQPFTSLGTEQLEAVASLGEVVQVEPGAETKRENIKLAMCIYGEYLSAEMQDVEQKEGFVSKGVQHLSGMIGDALGQELIVAGGGAWTLALKNSDPLHPARVVVWEGNGLDAIIKLGVLKRGDSIWNADYDPSSAGSSPVTRFARSPSMKLAVLHDDKAGALKKVVVLRTLSPGQLSALAASLEVQYAGAGEVIFAQGSKGEEFFIIHSGQLEVLIDGRRVRTLGVGDYVGERALLYAEPRSATVRAVMDTELWKMGKQVFTSVVQGPILDYMKDRIAFQNTKVEIDTLECIRVIGKGGFGLVKMVRSKVTGTRYALKCVSIRQAVEDKQTANLNAERSILAELDHPFIIKFIRSYKSKQYVYFLMELVTGGELFDILAELGILSRAQAQFYIAAIILALEFLHERRIAYLDLKPENCLIDNHGYLKIIDFGVAERVINGKIFTGKGTPFYMAPEVIKPGAGFTTTADFWSLGVNVFDFMISEFPFANELRPGEDGNAVESKGVTDRILLEINTNPLKYQETFARVKFKDKEAESLIVGLLEVNPNKRLGAGPEGYRALKNHPFFAGFSWDGLLARQTTPPYKPAGEVYASDAEGDHHRKETAGDIPVIEYRPEQDGWEKAIVTGFKDKSKPGNGVYKWVGESDGRPYLKQTKANMYMYCVGLKRWCISAELGMAQGEIWAESVVDDGSALVPPEGRWKAQPMAVGNPLVRVNMDSDPSWLEEF